MSRKDKDAMINAVTYKLFTAMFDDIIMDHALEAHRYVAQSQMVCSLCNTKCNGAHVPGSSRTTASATPSSASATVDFRTGPTNNPTKEGGTVYMTCTVCSNPVASSRYAAHLSGCMGLTGVRRTATRSKVISDVGNRSLSPSSDLAMLSDDSKPLKSNKSKSKNKRTEEAEFNLKRKRPSPQTSPNKKHHTSKASPLKVDSFKSKSKRRESSAASFRDSPSSRGSSPAISIATPHSSFSMQLSPTFSSRGVKPIKGTGPPKRRPVSPPLPPVANIQTPAVTLDFMHGNASFRTVVAHFTISLPPYRRRWG
ncbi:hypothetical protein CYLTODRAFT_420458 [Cylindrobasidium torrendii FP15055 ss-10]|uniref:SAGA-associated factor 11 n=1 Tax=Cylindrobasidium torrendii FP15055 ss-10 TaxID=1314674 RepID=A0A0D7BGF4_9AGAR|nr:hypothetical protein CYLTODRAFT_420458 [Cylindrobasidium torrendii FP15055 ss-10]